jgi:hypothetical protein
MADNIWDNSDADNDGNNANNWSLGWVPKAGDVAVFDSATTSDNCTFTGAISCDGMRFDNAYAGTVDAATYDITLGTDGLDCTGGGSATLDLGSGTWTCSGDFDPIPTTFTRGTALVVLDGTSTIYGNGTYAYAVYDLQIDGTIVPVGNWVYVWNSLTVNGSFDCGFYTIGIATEGSVSVGASGEITALDIKFVQGGAVTFTSGATVNANVVTYRDATITTNGVVISGNWLFYHGLAWNDYTITFTDDFTCSGNVTFNANTTNGNLTVLNTSNNPNLTFQGNVTVSESGATLTWTKGSGTITFSGTNDQTITTPAGWTQRLESISYNKSSGTLDMAGDLYCNSLTVESGSGGTWDCGNSGYTLDVLNDLVLEGSGRWDAGNAVISIGGNYEYSNQTLWTSGWGTGTTTMTGTSKNILGNDGKAVNGLIIDGTITTTGAVRAQGGLTVNAGKTFTANYNVTTTSTADVDVSGTIDGTGRLYVYGELTMGAAGALTCDQLWGWDATIDNLAGGTINPTSEMRLRTGRSISGGTYAAGTVVLHNFSNGITLTLGTAGSQTITFEGDVTVECDAGESYTIDVDTYDPNIVFQGDLTINNNTTGTLTWNKGSGTITFSGTEDQTITTPAGWTQVLEDITINKSGGSVTLAGDVYTDSLTFIDGDLDLDGNTIDSAGSVDIQGDNGARFWNGVDADMNGGVIDIAAGTLTLTGSA